MKVRAIVGSALLKRNPFIRTIQFFTKIGVNFLRLFTQKNIYVEIICALLIILFLYTGINKLMDIGKFRSEMARSPFIENMSGFVSYAIPVSEILLSISLIMKKTRLIALYLSYGLMALFTGYIWLMLNYAYDLPCSCGGIISKLSWQEHLIFNACFTAMCLAGVILQTKINQSKFNNSSIR